MKKILRTALVLLVASAMLVSAVACGGSGKTTDASSSVASSSTNEQTQATVTEKPLDPVTLTVWPVTFAQNFPSGIQEDPVAKDIEKKLNIKIDVESHPDADKFQALMASGDLPDVIIPEGTNQYVKQLIEGNNVIEIESYLKDHGKDILQNASAALDYSKRSFSNETGKLYFIPNGIYPDAGDKVVNQAIVGPFLRFDYFLEIGAPELKSYDDVLNAVAAMLKKHPTNEDGQKFFGFSPWFEWSLWGYLIFTSWMEGKTYDENGLFQIDNETLVMESMLTADNSVMWEGVDFWNKAYKMGLLDPDALTQKYDTALQKGQSNRVLGSIASWQQRDSNKLLANAGYPERGYPSVPIPMTGKKNIFVNLAPVGQGGRMWAVTKNCKTPERAVDLINYFYNTDDLLILYNGTKGTDWVEENGVKKLTDSFIKLQQTDPNWPLVTGAAKYNNDAGLAGKFLDPKTNETLQIFNRDSQIKNITPLDKSMSDFYKVQLPEDIVPAGYKQIINKSALIGVYSPTWSTTTPDDIKRINEKIINYLKANLAKMVLTKDEAQYKAMKEKIINDVKAMDYDKSYNRYNTLWEKACQEAAPYLK